MEKAQNLQMWVTTFANSGRRIRLWRDNLLSQSSSDSKVQEVFVRRCRYDDLSAFTQ